MEPAFFIAMFAATVAGGALFGLRNLTNRLRAYLLKSEKEVDELRNTIDDLKHELEEVKQKLEG
jgi:hypothetical protein